MSDVLDGRRAARVAAVRPAGAPYDAGATAAAIRRAAGLMGWASPDGPTFANVIAEGDRVLIKPNWVLHRNDGPWGLDPLVTHPRVIEQVAIAALESPLGELVVGDAPLQRCDFDALVSATGTDEWSARLRARDGRFAGVRDFRRTKSIMDGGLRRAEEDRQPLDDFVLFDLGDRSLLEPITDDGAFRVTRYDPRYMAQTHRRGRHRYLVARAVMDAQVIINLAKLKTHRKAGITCALKNLIGINGNKEFLPHHRIGGSAEGGDCYPGRSRTKRALEYVFDRQNAASSDGGQRLWKQLGRALKVPLRLQGDKLGIDGAWSGNDTIWRTCLDLNRILLYGRADGTVADEPQRRVIHIADAVIGGQGDGPLSAEPLDLGLILAAGNPAAMDLVGSHLLRYDPAAIPITAHAFDDFLWPITRFGRGDVRLVGDLGDGDPAVLLSSDRLDYDVSYPPGWVAAAASAAQGLPAGG
jgi:uncharacterized protein (DUF362 family)